MKRYWYNTPNHGRQNVGVEKIAHFYGVAYHANGQQHPVHSPAFTGLGSEAALQRALDQWAAKRKLVADVVDKAAPAAVKAPACHYCGAPSVSGCVGDERTLACSDCGLIPKITNVNDSLQEIRLEKVPERLIRALRHEEEHEDRRGITRAIFSRLHALKHKADPVDDRPVCDFHMSGFVCGKMAPVADPDGDRCCGANDWTCPNAVKKGEK